MASVPPIPIRDQLSEPRGGWLSPVWTAWFGWLVETLGALLAPPHDVWYSDINAVGLGEWTWAGSKWADPNFVIQGSNAQIRPLVKGRYQILATVNCTKVPSGDRMIVNIKKNGVTIGRTDAASPADANLGVPVQAADDFDGVDDYFTVELTYLSTGAAIVERTSAGNYLSTVQALRIRG